MNFCNSFNKKILYDANCQAALHISCLFISLSCTYTPIIHKFDGKYCLGSVIIKFGGKNCRGTVI